jgi:hypothetical protein
LHVVHLGCHPSDLIDVTFNYSAVDVNVNLAKLNL